MDDLGGGNGPAAREFALGAQRGAQLQSGTHATDYSYAIALTNAYDQAVMSGNYSSERQINQSLGLIDVGYQTSSTANGLVNIHWNQVLVSAYGANQGADPIKGIHVIYESETPTIYRNTLKAIESGLPYILHYEPSLISANRGNMLKGYPPVSRSVQRDEYPYASTREGGSGVVFYVPGIENSLQGQHLMQLYSTLKPGDAFLVFLIPKGQEPENEWAPGSNPIHIAPAVKAGAAVSAILTILTWLSRVPAF